jgi:hypothetical protein
MSFLTPLYLIGAALVALPIVLHLLRRDVAPPLPFSAVRLLRRTPMERSRRHRLRDLLLLAMRVAALLLLAASFARPYRAGAVPAAGTTIVAVDRSFSMSPARMARARELARQAIDAAGQDRVLLVAFDERADVVSGSGRAADARAALAGIEPGFGATRYAAVLEKAADLLLDESTTAAGGAGRLVIVSDLQRSGFDDTGAELPEDIDLAVRDAGGSSGNLSVATATIDRREVLVTLRNAAAQALASDVLVTIDGQTLAPRRASVPANGTAEVRVEAGSDVRQVKAVLVNDWRDGYAADNERFAVRAAPALPLVLVVSGAPGASSGFYLTRALLAEGEEGPDFAVRSVTGPAFSRLSAAELRDVTAIVLLSTHGLDRRAGERLQAFVRGGGGVLVAAGPDSDAAVLSTLFAWTPPLRSRDVRDAGVLAATDLRHPVLRPFDAVAANLGQIAFARAWHVDAADGWRVVARYTNGDAALAERGEGNGRVLLLTSDVDRRWNDFPLHASFVPFTQEIARYLGARPPAASAYDVADVPPGVPAHPGFATRDGRTVAVNVDARESRIDRVTPAEFQSLVTRTASQARPRAARVAAAAESEQRYWRYGLMLMLAALVVEAFVGSR